MIWFDPQLSDGVLLRDTGEQQHDTADQRHRHWLQHLLHPLLHILIQNQGAHFTWILSHLCHTLCTLIVNIFHCLPINKY